MEPSNSIMSLHHTSHLSPNVNTPTAKLIFFSLPFEIRLLIYDQLLVQSGDLLRTFCTCNFCADLKNPSIGRESLNPSLLRTNRVIHDEALPILYSKNVFSFFCWGPFGRSNQFSRYSDRTHRACHASQPSKCRNTVLGPIANRHSMWAGAARIIACPSDAAKFHVRRIFFKLNWVYHRVLDCFPDEWWHLVESDVLRLFPGLEQIEIQICAEAISRLALFIVFRRKDLIAECKQDYHSDLANPASRLHPRAGAREDLHYIKALCDAVVASHRYKKMRDCSFGLDIVSWTHDDMKPTGSRALMEIGTKIRVGCRNSC